MQTITDAAHIVMRKSAFAQLGLLAVLTTRLVLTAAWACLIGYMAFALLQSRRGSVGGTAARSDFCL
jgi:hypothetical protein